MQAARLSQQQTLRLTPVPTFHPGLFVKQLIYPSGCHHFGGNPYRGFPSCWSELSHQPAGGDRLDAGDAAGELEAEAWDGRKPLLVPPLPELFPRA